jgi:GTPase SAR1 family protein
LRRGRFDYVREVHEQLFQKRAQYSDEGFKASMGRRMQKPVPVVLVATKCDLFDEGVCTFYQEVLDFAAHNNLIFLKVGCSRNWREAGEGEEGRGLHTVVQKVLYTLNMRQLRVPDAIRELCVRDSRHRH